MTKNLLFKYKNNRKCDVFTSPKKKRTPFSGGDILTVYKHRLKEDGCVICGYNEHMCALDFHHLHREKGSEISTLRTIEEVRTELTNFPIVVLCARCHREVGAGIHNEDALFDMRLIVGTPD